MKVIVIGTTSYKEHDLIVNAINQDGLVSFKVRGAQKNTSPFVWLNNPLVVAEVNWVENIRYRHQILKEAKLVSSPLINDASYDKMQNIGFVLEIINSMFQDEDKHLLFNDVIDFFDNIKGKSKVSLAQLVFLAKAIKYSGSAPEVNKCVMCGSTEDIVAFSLFEGGFICRNCLDPEIPLDFNPSEMKWVRYIFNLDSFKDLPEDKLPDDVARNMFIKFRDFVRDGVGANLQTIDSILKNL